MDSFIEKLVELKLGIGVTFEEAQVLTDLSRKAQEAKKKLEVGGSAADYEKARKDLEDYVAVLTTSQHISEF